MYNHALIPTTLPHEEAYVTQELEKELNKSKIRGYPILARWTSDFDCNEKTNWWYVIKDTPFDISKIKAKRRYEINKGMKFFSVRKINAFDYSKELFAVTAKAYTAWPEKYRPVITQEQFNMSIKSWDKAIVYGGFDKDNQELVSYAVLFEHLSCVLFLILRSNPESEKKAINAAMVEQIVSDYNDKLGEDGFYICDGARAIRHETAFQDYLEKYFEFRKAYCRLNIRYRRPFGIAVKILYPFRNIISKNGKMGNLIYSVLKMEECTK